MNKLAILRLWLGAVLLFGCSTSSDKKTDTNKSTAGSGGSSTSKGSAGSAGGATNNGTKKEGESCSNDADCATKLGCVISPVDSMTGFRVCARRCTADTECTMPDETCMTLTGKPADSHCWNFVKEAFKPCGPAATAVCDGDLECVYDDQGPSIPTGVCVNFCQIPGGMAQNDPSVLMTCPNGLSCVKLGDPDVGLCATAVARGEKCGLDNGTVCAEADICVTDVSNNAVGDSKCYQDCTDTMMCDAGKTCTDLGGASFCE
jgi:hypothetical protein